jgi:flagellar biosynthesis protein FlhF
MVVRRYVVKDMPEAVLLIRKDLGKEAVILSTRKVYVRKWMGIWRSRRIEVMAAAGGDVPVKRFAGAISDHSAIARKNVRSEQDVFHELAVSAQDSGREETTTGPQHDLTGEISSLVREIQDLKGFITQKATAAAEVKNETGEHTEQHLRGILLHELRDLGFSHEYGLTLVNNYLNTQYPGAASDNKNDILQSAKEQLAGLLAQQLEPVVQPEPIKKSTRVALFVGPTGVGKTTTIAKLAALHVLSGKKKVGLLTTDTFRVAAVDQLKTYAGILNVPIGIIRRDEDMTSAFNQQEDRDLILIDTTGRNYRDPVYVDEMKELFRIIPVDETFLVLPMTGKISDLYGLAKAFESVQFDKFLFTKMDETSTYGAVIELLDRCRHQLSYIATGQNVPDDLEVASLQKIVNCAFGEEAQV